MVQGLRPDDPIPITTAQLEQIAEEQGPEAITLVDRENRIFKTTPMIDDVEFTRYVQLDSTDAYLHYLNLYDK